MSIAILVAPKFDSATEYSYDWSCKAKDMLEEKGYKIIDIGGRRVSRIEVTEALKENSVAIYIHYNHGSEDAHWGSENEAVVDLENVGLLSGRETYCMNCLSAKKLGVEAWKGKATGYWGYSEVFTFTTEALDEFGEFANSGLKFRLEGKSWKECLQLAKDLAESLAQKLVAAGKYIASVILQGDADALRCYTEDMPPPSDCAFRRLAIRLFGPKIGWKLPSPMKLVSKLRSVDLSYFLIIVFFFILNRMDALVCGPLLDIGYAFQFSWWVFMTMLVVVASLLLYFSRPSKQNLWYSLFSLMLYVGGFLDILYVFSIPFPSMWLDPNFIHFWNIFYIFFKYPWTIREQVVWWIVWTLIIYTAYKWFKKKYKIYGIIKDIKKSS
jgi:hypothetical protein